MKSHDNPFNPDSLFFVIYVTVLCEPSFNQYELSSILHMQLCAAIDFIEDIFLWLFFMTLFSHENHLRYHVIYVTKNIPWKFIGVSKVFLGCSYAVV